MLAFPFAFSVVCLFVLLLLLQMCRCGFVTGAHLPRVSRWFGVCAAALGSKAQGPYPGERLAVASARAKPAPAACSASCSGAVVDFPPRLALGFASEWCLRRRPGPQESCLGARLAGVRVRVWCAEAVPALGLHRQGPAAGRPAEAQACAKPTWPELLGSAAASGESGGECEVARAVAPTARPASGNRTAAGAGSSPCPCARVCSLHRTCLSTRCIYVRKGGRGLHKHAPDEHTAEGTICFRLRTENISCICQCKRSSRGRDHDGTHDMREA